MSEDLKSICIKYRLINQLNKMHYGWIFLFTSSKKIQNKKKIFIKISSLGQI